MLDPAVPIPLPTARRIAASPRPEQPDDPLRSAAQALESSFLAVMLDAGGLGAPRDSFGGGIGEEQFASFLTEAYAREMVQRGGIGLAETLFEALKDRADVRA